MISEKDLTTIAEDICEMLFETVVVDDGDDAASTMTAVVDITGDWNGSVSVSCSRATAVGLASSMFDAPGPELSRNDVVDALGELANMVGGAVKGMFEGEKSLGLPTVGEGTDFTMSVPRTYELAAVEHKLATGSLVRLAVHAVQD